MKRIISLLTVVFIVGVLALALISEPVLAMTGSGTEGDPFMIYDVNDLQNMNNNLTAYYELANDVDASATSGWNIKNYRGDWDWYTDYYVNDEVLYYGNYFYCTQAHTSGGLGSFNSGYWAQTEITIGCIGFEPVGRSGSFFEGTLDGNGHTIYGLYMNRPYEMYIGLFGRTSTATIKNIGLTNVDITGESVVGGLVGVTYETSIENVYSHGTVTGYYTVGGVAGLADGTWNMVCSFGNVIGYGEVGGLVGDGGTEWLPLDIYDSYSRADVTATSSVGGFIGYMASGTTNNCYSTGEVTGDTEVGGFEGGYSGVTGNTATACFWDKDTSGQSTSISGTGKTISQMKTESTFTGAGWDFNTVWGMADFINDGYPYLFGLGGSFGGGIISQVIWFQPNNIISGTTLPDRATSDGSQDGEITWGSNPAGVSVGLTGFYSDYAPANITLPQEIITPPQDMVGPTGNPGNTRDVGTLVDNPLYPLVKVFSDNTGIPVKLWWIILASIIVMIAMVVTYWKLPHQMITALVGGGLSAFFYAMGIYPFWVVLIFAVMALAIILGERSPTV